MAESLFPIHNKTIKKHAIIAILVWSVIVALSAGWNIYANIQKTSELAMLEARALFNKDKAIRYWGSFHGGVYVPLTEKTPPNPFLAHIEERDILTPKEKKLTLMNPAYMLRQMMETYEEVYGVKGHITSLVYFRPETAPDEWEKKALERFSKGEKEVSEFTTINNKPYLRLMQPLYAKKSCLKCHGFQGYKEGDLRGGVSLSLPMNMHIKAQKNSIAGLAASHLIFWILGITVILLYGRKLGEKTDELISHQEHLSQTVDERTTELKEANEKLIQTNQKLEIFNETLVNREARIIEVKKEVNQLCSKLGEKSRYKEIEKEI